MIILAHVHSTWTTIASQAYNLNDACSENTHVIRTYGGSTFEGLYGGAVELRSSIRLLERIRPAAVRINDGDQNGTSTVNEHDAHRKRRDQSIH